MEPDSTEVTSSDDEPPSTLEQARLEWQARSQKQPGDTAKRAGPSDITNDQNQSPIAGSSDVPPSSEVVTVDPLEELLEPPTVDTLKDWTKMMLTDSSGQRIDLPKLESTFKSTKGLPRERQAGGLRSYLASSRSRQPSASVPSGQT